MALHLKEKNITTNIYLCNYPIQKSWFLIIILSALHPTMWLSFNNDSPSFISVNYCLLSVHNSYHHQVIRHILELSSFAFPSRTFHYFLMHSSFFRANYIPQSPDSHGLSKSYYILTIYQLFLFLILFLILYS